MRKVEDLTGRVFGRLTVIERAPSRYKSSYWRCRCECGNVTEHQRGQLLHGTAKSCGCLQREQIAARNAATTTHGLSATRAYGAWKGAMSRCYNVRDDSYSHYGARGIAVCERWHDVRNFFADMGECPAGMSIDRIDVDGNYEPSNCRWATTKEQGRNRRSNDVVTIGGVSRCLSEWAELSGLRQVTLHARIHRYGWTPERAISTPART
jgi:hypothetical protein